MIELLPWLIPVLAALLLLALRTAHVRERASWIVATLATGLTFITSVFLLGTEKEVFSVFRVDTFSLFLNILYSLVALLVLLNMFGEVREQKALFHAVLLLSLFAMMLVSAAVDLILIYLTLEFLSITLYFLIAYDRSKIKMEAGIKYFISSMLSSAIAVFGLSLIYGLTGTTRIAAVVVQASPLLVVGITAVVAGLSFKMGVFPFNLWLVDVYEGAESNLTAFLAGASKKAAFAAFIRIFISFLPALALYWVPLVVLLSFVTMAYGNITALRQQNVKRMIAYSVIGQAGYMLIGIASMTNYGLAGVLMHMFVHALMAGGAFFVIAKLLPENLFYVKDYRGLASRSPLLAFVFTVFLFSLSGMPLLAGFVSKFILFGSAIQAGITWLAIAAVINSGISVFFYFNIVREMYSYPGKGIIEIPTLTKVVVSTCAVLIFLLGIFPQTFLKLVQLAVATL